MDNNTKYELTEETKKYHGITLHRIKALRSFGSVSKGDLGGWIASESNLSQRGNAWVFGNARAFGHAEVSGNAKVSGNAEVFSNAKVFGDAKSRTRVYTSALLRHSITLTDTHVAVGCEMHTHSEWLEKVDDIGHHYEYTTIEIQEYKTVLQIMIQQKQRELKERGIKYD